MSDPVGEESQSMDDDKDGETDMENFSGRERDVAPLDFGDRQPW